ncbi:MAG: hypothetical protein IKK77_00555 [Clostridia bacterium]|nr:hypothetical protein [Clostridia bacterium]
MIKKLFYFSFKPQNIKGLILSFIIYVAINLIGVLLRKLFVFLFLALLGGLIGLLTNIYSFIGICLLLYHYLIEIKENQ